MRKTERKLEKKRKKKGGSNGENLREWEKKRNCPFDAKGETKDAIVQRMEAFAREFIAKVTEDKSLVIKTDKIKIQSSYGKFDKFVVGVSVQLQVEEKQAHCLYVQPKPQSNKTEDNEAETDKMD